MKFRVIDKKTNKQADEQAIALNEEWAKHLCYCDMEGFAIQEDGSLVLTDECGKFAYCPEDRFIVDFEEYKDCFPLPNRARDEMMTRLRASGFGDDGMAVTLWGMVHHACREVDRLLAAESTNEAEIKRLKTKRDPGEVCSNCGERAVHLTLYDDRVCSACNHLWLAEDLDDEPLESAEEWLDNASEKE